jgi:hypothetical protein
LPDNQPQVGILFHAAEYPAFDQQHFPVHLGYCQANSTLRFNQRSMDLRNILWWRVSTATAGASTAQAVICFEIS